MFGQTLRRLFVPITASRNQSTVAAQKVSVNAYFVARRLNLKNVQAVEDVFETPSPKPNEFEKKYVIETIDASKHQHILVFKFGSVVFLNVPEERQLWHLRRITKGSLPHKSTTEGFIAEGSQLTEDYKIMVHEKLDKPSVFKAQHVNILSLNKQNMEIICTVVAQSVALKYCAKQVGKMLERFMEINKVIEDTGSISQIEGAKYKDLKKLVAENNTVICNVIYELGIFEGTDAGWDSSECHETWEGLRREFQIDLRFKDLEKKLDIIDENARFFIDMLQKQNGVWQNQIITFLLGVDASAWTYYLYWSISTSDSARQLIHDCLVCIPFIRMI